jgi:hypothetical protein
MPGSRFLIESQVLSTGAVSVTFSSIPATYKDLVLKINARSAQAQTYEVLTMRFNGSEVAEYSNTRLQGDGSTAISGRNEDDNAVTLRMLNGNSSTANTFGSMEIYIPSYTASTQKPLSSFGVSESNTTSPIYMAATAALWRNTSAITSILLRTNSGDNWLTGSSFYLYGISSTV